MRPSVDPVQLIYASAKAIRTPSLYLHSIHLELSIELKMSAPHNSTYTSTVEESLHNSTFEVRETSPLRPSVWALPIAPSRWRARTERRERTGGGARRAEVAGVAEVVEARRSAPRPSPCHPASPPPPHVEEATDRRRDELAAPVLISTKAVHRRRRREQEAGEARSRRLEGGDSLALLL